MEVFWEAIRPVDEPLRHRWFLPAVAAILAVSVPWYLPDAVGNRLIGGLPLWTWVTVICGAALAGLTAYASLRLWRDGGDDGAGDVESAARNSGSGS